jgi:hypothetical protein
MPGNREFSQGGSLDTARPSAALVQVLDQLPGPDRRCAGLDDEQLVGVIGQWAAAASWATSAKLRVTAELQYPA